MVAVSLKKDFFQAEDGIRDALVCLVGSEMCIRDRIAEEDRRNEFFNNLINAVLLICGIISIICIIFVKPIVSVIGIGFSDETKRYTEILLCFVMIASVCIFLIYTISGFLNTKKNFYYNGVQLIITNFIVIIAVMLSKESCCKDQIR